MFNKVLDFFKNYNKAWILPDFLFLSDMFASGVWGEKYYDVFSFFGITGSTTSTIVCALELVRLIALIAQKHSSPNNPPK